MLIKVTADHIRRGKRGDSCSCAVALAIAEMLSGCIPEVAPVIVYLIDGRKLGLPATVRLPQEVTEWIDAFDKMRPVEPFEFELPIERPLAA